MRDSSSHPKPLPARLNAEDVAEILNVRKEDIHLLVAAKLLKPLGKPTQSATKFFARCTIEKLAEDPEWLSKMTQVIYDYWKEVNEERRPPVKPPVTSSETSSSLQPRCNDLVPGR